MKKYLNILMILVFLAGTVSCNDYEIFEREQYKVVFALVSEDENSSNVFKVVHDLESEESTGYVAISCGGTNPAAEAVNLTLRQDKSPFNKYNKDNFDMATDKFAKLLPASHFDIDSYNVPISAGARSGRLPIRIRPNGLSPDSIYFIPLKVDEYSAYEFNPSKSDILYRVLIKNRYATQAATTMYNMRGVLGEVGKTGVNQMGVKRMHPISGNSVRITAGTVQFEEDAALINDKCIVLTVAADNKVSFSTYKNMEVTAVDGDPDFPNIFMIEDDGYSRYRTFLLCYKYKDKGTEYLMKEELRYKLSKEEEKEISNR
jgi:hypothetical protein